MSKSPVQHAQINNIIKYQLHRRTISSSSNNEDIKSATKGGNGYNIKDLLPLIDKKDRIRESTTGTEASINSGIVDRDYYAQGCKNQRHGSSRQCFGGN
ncbi:MAG: hypothetical protein M3Z01_04210 [Thermoproteota archaeon]|nr:hypothetical protein [Thermoproteota archaeon]